MLPIIIGVGLVSLLVKAFSDDDSEKPQAQRNQRKKLFISFAKEDEKYIDDLIRQARILKSLGLGTESQHL